MDCHGLLLALTTIVGPTPVGSEILAPKGADFLHQWAAREVRRYVRIRTGKLLKIREGNTPGKETAIILCQLDDPLASSLLESPERESLSAQIGESGSLVRSVKVKGKPTVLLAGVTSQGVLGASYRWAETMGVRFGPDRDIIPDGRVPLREAGFNLTFAPRFSVRGAFPYHSGNPQGPEYWGRDGYMLAVGQMAKAGLNRIALLLHHRGDGSIDAAWTPSWEEPYQVGQAPFGMDRAFPSDHYRVEEAVSRPRPDQKREVSDANEAMLSEVFSFGRMAGVDAVMGGFINGGVDYWKRAFDHLRKGGFQPSEIWQHTYENWLYTDPEEPLLASVSQGFRDYLEAAKQSGFTAKAVVSGWTAGPRKDPLRLHRDMPGEVIMAPQVKDIGRAEVEPAYGDMGSRPRWVVPWLEDDFNMIAPQLWVGRTLGNLDAGWRLGARGYLATLWRTRAVEPQWMALAQRGWDRSLTADKFLLDYSVASFGPEAGPAVSRLMARLDGKLPRPTDWKEGWPGGIHYDAGYWEARRGDYSFVSEMESLLPLVKGPRSRERYEELLARLRALRALGKLRSFIGTPQEEGAARETVTEFLQVATSLGDLGDLIFLNRQLSKGKPMGYQGTPRLFLPVIRPSLLAGESLNVRGSGLEPGIPRSVTLEWRFLGEKNWRRKSVPLTYRSSFSAQLPASETAGKDFEWRLRAVTSQGALLASPPTEVEGGHTVVIIPRGAKS